MKKGLFDYLHIIIGSLILALGINVFLAPNKISTGGVGGLATIFLYVFRIPMSLSTLVLNLILFVIGYKTLPKSSIVKTLVGIVFLSVFLQLTSYISYYCDDMMISAIFGGTLVGVGVGLVVLKDASTGGSDFAAIILNKAIPYISLATFILIIDALIILTSGMVFRDYTIMFYAVLSLYVSTKVTDMIMVRGDYAKSVFIISEKSNVIAKEILDTIERGVTGIYSKGLYHGKDGLMLLCIVKSKELHILMNIVKKIDKEAFVIISEARKILGEGFKEQ